MDNSKTSSNFGKLYIGFIIAVFGLLFSTSHFALVSIITLSIITILTDIVAKTNTHPGLSENLQNFERYMIIISFLLVLFVFLTGCYNIFVLLKHMNLPAGTIIGSAGPQKITASQILTDLVAPIISFIGLIIANIGIGK